MHNQHADQTTILKGQDLDQALGTGNAQVETRIADDTLELNVISHKAFLDINIDLHQENPFLSYGIGLLVTLFVGFVLHTFRPIPIPAITDIRPRVGSNQIIQLDGLRGVAALLVMLEHTWAPFAGAGATGVWLFFILSGYLLALPFVKKPGRAIDRHYVGPYMMRRIGRILPMYFFVIIIIYGFGHETPLMVEHLLFLAANGHFWTIPQELSFYLLLPFIMVFGWMCSNISKSLFFPGMLGLCILFLWKPELAPFTLPGTGRPPYVGWFLLGVVIASLTPFLEQIRRTASPTKQQVFGAIGLLLFAMILIASCYGFTSTYVMDNVTLPVNFPKLFAILLALILLLLLVAPHSALGSVLKWLPLRAVGIVGFSFYLLHPFVIQFILDFSQKFLNKPLLGAKLFIVASLLTWLISLFTYSHIERPFLSKSKND